MKERPILFSAPMVRALLDSTKTQTRRAWRIQPPPGVRVAIVNNTTKHYGGPGDRLWVRETWRYCDWSEEGEPHIEYAADGARTLIEDFPEDWGARLMDTWTSLSTPSNFDIDQRAADRRWRPSIHMPRWACRILLEVTEVRVKRLQDISDNDARAEGVERIDAEMGMRLRTPHWRAYGNEDTQYCISPAGSFQALWKSINGAESWGANPWVWAISFRRIEA